MQVCMYVYVCINVCMYASMYVFMNVCTYVCIYEWKHIFLTCIHFHLQGKYNITRWLIFKTSRCTNYMADINIIGPLALAYIFAFVLTEAHTSKWPNMLTYRNRHLFLSIYPFFFSYFICMSAQSNSRYTHMLSLITPGNGDDISK